MSGRDHKNHHYLPRGILKFFGLGKKNQQIFFIDKKVHLTVHKTNIKNVACINHFYDFKASNTSLEVDFFGDIDNNAPSVIKKLLRDIHRPQIDKIDINNLSLYIASQISRVPYLYNTLDNISRAFKAEISDKVSVFDDNIKDYFLTSVIETTKIYQDILSNLSFRVIRTKEKQFVIGDNPVIILEHGEKTIVRGTHACAINGRVFMMPISPQDILVYYHHDFREKLIEYVNSNNFWQYVNSTEYVFGHSDRLLERGLKAYYYDAYDFLVGINPDLVNEQKLKRGDPVYIGQSVFSFEGQALEYFKKTADDIYSNNQLKRN